MQDRVVVLVTYAFTNKFDSWWRNERTLNEKDGCSAFCSMIFSFGNVHFRRRIVGLTRLIAHDELNPRPAAAAGAGTNDERPSQ